MKLPGRPIQTIDDLPAMDILGRVMIADGSTADADLMVSRADLLAWAKELTKEAWAGGGAESSDYANKMESVPFSDWWAAKMKEVEK